MSLIFGAIWYIISVYADRKEEPDVKRTAPEIEKYCAYCENAALLHSEDYVLCEKKGVVAANFVCRKFSYDPLKRRAAKAAAPKLEYVDIDS